MDRTEIFKSIHYLSSASTCIIYLLYIPLTLLSFQQESLAHRSPIRTRSLTRIAQMEHNEGNTQGTQEPTQNPTAPPPQGQEERMNQMERTMTGVTAQLAQMMALLSAQAGATASDRKSVV